MNNVILYIVLALPIGQPVLLENNEKFKTHEECVKEGATKAPQIAQELAEGYKMPVRFRFWCEGEERTSI